MKKLLTFTLLLAFSTTLLASTLPLSSRTDVHAFIEQMVEQDHFDKAALTKLFDKVNLHPEIIVSITKPYEAKPWHIYRGLFVNAKRINGGVRYWHSHEQELRKAEQKFGIPASMIVAILGIETVYGQQQGRYRVLESLSTLAFNYPRRAKFFQRELREFLLLTREQKIDPFKPLGSYAGAIGAPQFMPSSYRAYAVDFSGNGRKDLVNNDTDVIGSIANYFKRHGWIKGRLVAIPAHVKGDAYTQLQTSARHHSAYKPDVTIADLKRYGITANRYLDAKRKAHVIKLDNKKNNEYWLGFHNFYVITRYNSSKLYAMAALQLSREIQQRYERSKKVAENQSSSPASA